MNLLQDDFISTTVGKISLKTILTSNKEYQLQYYFDEIQLSMLQLLSSLTTVVLAPTIIELKEYIRGGLSVDQYDKACERLELDWFDTHKFMRSKPLSTSAKWADAPITKLLSGIECGSSSSAIGLFSDAEAAKVVCPDCTPGLNYNLHMNIKGECFGPTGATGIRGGGAISTLIAGHNLKTTLLSNTIAIDYFKKITVLDDDAEDTPMWVTPQSGSVYQAGRIGLVRGLFALAYHIDFDVKDAPCCCDVCGHHSDQSVVNFRRQKYTGHYGSTKNGRDAGAGWWPHPFTPRSIKDDGAEYAVCARDRSWQSWQELSGYIIGKEMNKANVIPAYIVNQYMHMENPLKTNLLVGGNIANQGSIIGRIYDLYSMPASLTKYLSRVTLVIDVGLQKKERLSNALNKIFGVGYDKSFVGGIKEKAIQQFTANAQQIIQQTLLDVDRKEASELRKAAIEALNTEAKKIFLNVQRQYQHDMPLFKALVRGEVLLYKK